MENRISIQQIAAEAGVSIATVSRVINAPEKVAEHTRKRIEAIIQSMTPEERRNEGILNGSRKKRIAAGSGTSVQEVNKLLKQFEQTKKMMKQFSGMAKKSKKGKGFPSFPGFPGM